MHRNAIEEVAVLSEDVRFWPFTHDGSRRQHDHVFQFFHRDVQPDTLTRTKAPDHKRLTLFLIAARLIGQRNKKIERPVGGVDGICEVPNLKRLIQCGPTGAVVLSEFDVKRPTILCRLLQGGSFILEGVPLDVERMMVGQHGQELPRLHLVAELGLQLLHLVRDAFGLIVDQLRLGLRIGFAGLCRDTVFNRDRWRRDDLDRRDKLPFCDRVDLFGVQAACEQVLAIRLYRSGLTAELAIEVDQL